MSDLYDALCTERTQHRAEIICSLHDLLEDEGYVDMFACRLPQYIYDRDIIGRIDKIEAIIIQAGCNHLRDAGIEVVYDDVHRQPDILLEMITTIFITIDNWEDYESLIDMISSESAFGLSTVIAVVSGTLEPSKYMDVITSVEDRVYKMLINYVNHKMKTEGDDNPERMDKKIVDLIREFCKRCPTNPVAVAYTISGIEVADEAIMSTIDYEYEELAPQQYYKNISEAIVGLIVRREAFYTDGYDLICKYADLLIESDEPRDNLAICKAANMLLKDIYNYVEKEHDEEIRSISAGM
ncbi:hypothetical protein [Clostridium sp.]|uniref:hypothetical protein n=1 Tax=Clostridium sp. TaxID=1506 RepID=UPI003F6761F2